MSSYPKDAFSSFSSSMGDRNNIVGRDFCEDFEWQRAALMLSERNPAEGVKQPHSQGSLRALGRMGAELVACPHQNSNCP